MLINNKIDDIFVGDFVIKFTRDPDLVRRAQQLRYEIFLEEKSANLTSDEGVDKDKYDQLCDHLLIFKREGEDSNVDNWELIGNYRMLTEQGLNNGDNYFTEDEFDLSNLKQQADQLCELGRSCVKKEYRTGAIIALLWKGIGTYLEANNKTILFGCASFPGLDIDSHLNALSYLHHYHLADESIRTTPVQTDKQNNFIPLPKEEVKLKQALKELPPLVKGYLRLNAVIGQGIYFDYEMNCIDVCIMVDRNKVDPKYVEKFTKVTKS